MVDDTVGSGYRMVLSGERFEKEFGRKIFVSYEEGVKKTVQYMKKHSSSFLNPQDSGAGLGNHLWRSICQIFWLLVPYLENLVCFIPFFMLNNRAVSSQYFSKLDFYLLYVLLFAIVYGQQQAIFSALLATAGYCFRQMYDKTGFEVLLDYNTYVWMAQLFIVGMVVGYMKDQIKNIRNQDEDQIQYLNGQLGDMSDINDSNVRMKHTFERQIVNQKDSLGKIYEITSQLDQRGPEEVLFYASQVLSKLMETDDAAIYTVANKDYARLFSFTSQTAKKLGKSIRYSDMKDMYDELLAHRVYINKTMDSNYPLMACAVYSEDHQDLTIMEACLKSGVNYLDTANYEPKDVAHFEYSWQWAYKKRFEDAGLTAILGCGFDPGVSGIYTAYAAKHHFDEIQYLDIVDCNAGNHHKAFATNFNPEINIREITQNGRYYENGEWVTTKPLEIHKALTYPNIGPRDSYLLYHEELESLVKNFPTIKRARFWMTFGQEYLTHLRVIQNIGMARIDEVEYNGMKIVPLQFLKAVLPNPQDLGENYEGETSIGCRIRGLKDGKEHTYYIYNNCSHQEAYKETGMQGVSYTTGVPAMIGAMMFLKGLWKRPGVWNVEEFDPDPFMEQLNKQGLPWHEVIDGNLEV